MKKVLVFTVMMMLLVAVSAPADVITGVTIIGSTAPLGPDYPAGTLVNGSGMVGELHNTGAYQTMYISASASVVDNVYVIFDLGAPVSMGKIRIWNYNNTPSQMGWCVENLNILVSESDPSFSTPANYQDLGSFNLKIGSGSVPIDSNDFAVSPTGNVRYVKFDINTIWSGQTTSYVGLSEVRFYDNNLNTPPVVDAGSGKGTKVGQAVALAATATDDGLPNPPAALTYAWSKISGPGNQTFSPSASVEDPNVSCDAAGDYVFQLTVSDGDKSASDTVSVKVLPADYTELSRTGWTASVPSSIWGAKETAINGTGLTTSPDGLYGVHSSNNAHTWLTSGGTVADQYYEIDLNAYCSLNYIRMWNFTVKLDSGVWYNNLWGVKGYKILAKTNAGDAWTQLTTGTLAAYPQTITEDGSVIIPLDTSSLVNGVRYLQIDIDSRQDGVSPGYVGFSEVKLSGAVSNYAPVVPSSRVEMLLSDVLAADPNVTDDGKPTPPSISYQWSVISGDPSKVAFSPSATVRDPNITFSQQGYYVLQLTANDGQLVGTGTISVRVLPADWSRIGEVSVVGYSSQFETRAPIRTCDGSGLNANGLLGTHSNNAGIGHWNSAYPTTVTDQYIIYDLGTSSSLNWLRIWNHNDASQKSAGVKDFELIGSPNDPTVAAGTTLGAFSIAQGPGSATVDYSEVKEFSSSTSVRYVKLKVLSNWGFVDLTGLAEIQFSQKYLAGDFDDDNAVDFNDLQIFAGEWLKCTDPCNVDCIKPWLGGTEPTLLHRWSFNGNANDSVGTATATLSGAATIGGNALDLSLNQSVPAGNSTDPNASWASLPIISTLQGLANGWTVECWVYQTQVAKTGSRVWDFGTSGSNAMMLQPNYSGRTMGGIAVPGSSGYGYAAAIDFTEPNMVVPNVWQHVVVTGTKGATGKVKLYVDGVLQNESTNTDRAPADVAYVNCFLGRYVDEARTDVPFWAGKIDELRIYDGALSYVKIIGDYNCGPDSMTCPGPINCQQVRDAGVTLLTDITGTNCITNFEDFATVAAEWLK